MYFRTFTLPRNAKASRVFSFGNFKELNHKTPTFMYCFFKLSGYAFLQNEKCLYFVVQMYIPFDLLIPKRAIMTIFGD